MEDVFQMKKRNAVTGKIEIVKNIHVRVRKVLKHGIGNTVWASGSSHGEVRASCKKFSSGEGKTKG